MKLFLLCTVLFFLVGCEKSFENFTPDNGSNSDTLWVGSNTSNLEINSLYQELQPTAITDTFNLQNGGTIQLGNFGRVEIPSAAFSLNGSVATGTGRLAFYLLKTKGSFIRFQKPTNSATGLLQTNNIFQANFTRNNQSLTLINTAPLQVFLNDSSAASNYKIYTGIEPVGNSFIGYSWGRNDTIPLQTNSNGYRISTSQQQWHSLGFSIDSSAPKARVILSMPSDYTNANTAAYVVFKNSNSVLQFLPDATNRIWLTEKVPTGKPVIYITLTKKNNTYWLGTQETTTANQNIRITPEQKSLTEIISYLDKL